MSKNDSETRSLWDITPIKTIIELSQGNLRLRESCVHQGRIRVSKATPTPGGKQECVWLYVQAESRDGADVTLSEQQARELRDALDECIEDNDE